MSMSAEEARQVLAEVSHEIRLASAARLRGSRVSVRGITPAVDKQT